MTTDQALGYDTQLIASAVKLQERGLELKENVAYCASKSIVKHLIVV